MVLFAFVGPCPEGMECCHENDVRDDNRIENLRWDTHANNLAQRRTFKRDAGVKRATSCPHGHPYDKANTYVHAGKRYCRACRRDKKRAARGNYRR
jgi:hypothetical protein